MVQLRPLRQPGLSLEEGLGQAGGRRLILLEGPAQVNRAEQVAHRCRQSALVEISGQLLLPFQIALTVKQSILNQFLIGMV